MPLSSGIKVVNLSDYPEHLDFVAQCHYDMWDHKKSRWSLEKTKDKIRHRCETQHLPMTFVALREDIPVGTGSLWIEDCPDRTDLSPWLACLYVPEQYRLKGVARALVFHRFSVLKELGFKEAYIWSSKKNIVVHENFGWKLYDANVSTGCVMKKEL